MNLLLLNSYSQINKDSLEIEKTEYDLILERLFENDQKVRKNLDKYLNENPSTENQDQLIKLMKMVESTDKENQKEGLIILEKYLNKELFLNKSSLRYLYYIIQHADGKIQNKYKQFIEDLFKELIIDNKEYAWFVDRLRVRNNKAQKYGLQVKSWQDTNDSFPYPISENSENNFEKLSLESSKSFLNRTFLNEYSPLYINKDEFVIFGHVYKNSNNTLTGIKDVVVINSNREITRTNNNGFYVLKIKRNKSDFITFKKGSFETNREFESGNIDWIEVNVYLD